MPCLEITFPRSDEQTKEKLAAELTEGFARVLGFPADIFGIKFYEYAPDQAASGGKLVKDIEGRPYIHFIFYSPRIKRTTKQELVKVFTEIFTKVMKQPEWKPVIHIIESPYDNVGVDGELLSDAYESCASSEFYYKLPKD